ncbi:MULTISPECIES: NAD-dependent epimerase/dehydratase family protein [Cryobacterium]|uniref:NAD-dependent epimerase/dehydratase family protein n=1 Tax=Cryobacterium breve TaxID=1259258 RepID=A0ABY2JDM8_9MICO|nr:MULTISPECIES: NAD-dependent epimerase/dehydratase family protein [Cryobacterium]TFC92930.1 NAD-dependent epimerase/dehydratase family protein [Cryobacterium sp. TmT3-12]TFD02109.1 NAD-dependent epimerase/dehydratase family protein [Cryobacterium breve]
MTTNSHHVVLGGNGIIGRETVRALLRRAENTTSVGRRPSTIDGVSSLAANLLTAADASRALTGADVAYFTVGLPYSASIWAQQWPIILRNTIDAAIAHNTHLIYFDNVYAYGLVDGPMTEQSPISAISKKGRIRAAALTALDAAEAERGLSFTVARSADFYGPGAATSVFNTFALVRIAAGKTGTWLFNADQPHSVTYTPDIGESLAILGTHPAGSGNIWHLPTAPALTGREYLQLAGAPDSRINVMSRTTMRIGALFNTAARETLEMSYQYAAPYIFDSRAFETAFGISPTPIADGITTTLAAERVSS